MHNQRKTYSETQLIDAVKTSVSYAEVLRKLNLKVGGANYEDIKRHISELDLDISHFTGKAWNQGLRYRIVNPPKPLSEILIKGSTYKSTSKLKDRLIKAQLKEAKCECCNETKWLDQPIPLELHHIDGDHSNLTLENLQLLCPNCHALTDNYRGKNIAKFKNEPIEPIVEIFSDEDVLERNLKRAESRRIPQELWKRTTLEDKVCPICGKTFHPNSSTQKYCSVDCYEQSRDHGKRPSYEELITILKENKGNFTAVGRLYNVTDNAVRKWCKLYQIDFHSEDYKE